MFKRIAALTLTCLFAGALLPAPAAYAAPRCFPEAAPVIAHVSTARSPPSGRSNGGLPVFGYPIGEQQPAGRGQALQLQAFERNRLELHPENAAPYDVLLGRLGASLAKQGRDWNTFGKVDPITPHYFGETGHAIAPQFWGYWSSHGLEFDGQRARASGEPGAVRPAAIRAGDRNQPDRRQALPDPALRAGALRAPPRERRHAIRVLLGLLGRELDAGGTPAPMLRLRARIYQALSFRPPAGS